MKITLGEKTYEVTKITCGKMNDYYEVMDSVDESEKVNGRTTKKDFDLIKEFLANFFGNQFTTVDIDNELDVTDLMTFWIGIGIEIKDKTQSKVEKLIKK
ncbi:phage tail assembly chaperone G [Clostridium intestinale]|uniref:Phage protein n=1 Tax=Clostridium intestinale TaxID=36845 RepID=A0A7D6W409_9CLOT|nr:hypothetical protein [Clostridium intestinale]QLY82231.1 hypothetical protein HZF06_11770 [Clostridium intestinale]